MIPTEVYQILQTAYLLLYILINVWTWYVEFVKFEWGMDFYQYKGYGFKIIKFLPLYHSFGLKFF